MPKSLNGKDHFKRIIVVMDNGEARGSPVRNHDDREVTRHDALFRTRADDRISATQLSIKNSFSSRTAEQHISERSEYSKLSSATNAHYIMSHIYVNWY